MNTPNPTPNPELRQAVLARLCYLNGWHTARDITQSVQQHCVGFGDIAVNRFFQNDVVRELQTLIDEGLVLRLPNPDGEGNVYHPNQNEKANVFSWEDPTPNPELRQDVLARLRYLNGWHTPRDVAHSVLLNCLGYSRTALNRFFINEVIAELHGLLAGGLAVQMPNPDGEGNVFHWAEPARTRQRNLLEALAVLLGDTPASKDLLAIRAALR